MRFCIVRLDKIYSTDTTDTTDTTEATRATKARNRQTKGRLLTSEERERERGGKLESKSMVKCRFLIFQENKEDEIIRREASAVVV